MKQCLDYSWKFHLGDVPFPEIKKNSYGSLMSGKISGAVAPEFDDHEWRVLDLPHDWAIEGKPNPSGNVDQGFLPRGTGWYRKPFVLPAESENKKVYLEFEGVARNSTVWLNGFRLGTHRSGYTSFGFDISDIVLSGGAANMLALRVDGREIEGWWYEGCGIYRHVWLVIKERLHFERWGVFVITPRVSTQEAEVQVEMEVKNEGEDSVAFVLAAEIIDHDGLVVAKGNSSHTLSAGAKGKFVQKFIITRPLLWSPEQPNLYRVRTEIRQGERAMDLEEIPFGVRWFEFTSDRGFLLNGEPLKIQGTCNHQDFAGVGIALPDRLHWKKIELLKESGCNAYRCAHHPPAPALLDVCDHLGMLVMDENRHLDSSEEGIADLRSMVRRDRNHPCVILWSLENEQALEGKEIGTRILKTLYRVVKREDSTRPVTAAICHDWNSAGYADVLDVVGYNYSHGRYREDHEKFPFRKMCGSEICASFSSRGIYECGHGYCNAYNTTFGPGTTPENTWKAIAENPFMAGGFIWSGFDYRGEPAPYEWPNISSQFGLMDTCGFPKDVYYYYQSVWTQNPMVHIFPHWNWPGRENQPINIWCYSNCDEVELFLNGKSLGRKEMQANGHLEWVVDYAPGEISAHGFRRGKVVASKIIKTSGPPAQLRLFTDRQSLVADNTDVACVTVQIIDAENNPVPTADPMLAFRVAGAGKLIGLGNGDPKDQTCDKDNRRRAFNGFCLALIQSAREPGTVALEVTSEGFPPAVLDIKIN